MQFSRGMRRWGFINGLLSRSPYFAAFSWRRFVEVDEWLAPGNGVDLALALLREPLAENKLAGILILWRKSPGAAGFDRT